MMMKTKVVATLGPATENLEQINGLYEAGVNVFRLNLKHNQIDWHRKTINLVRRVAPETAVMVDVPRLAMINELTNYDFLALSYVETKSDVLKAKKKTEAGVIAKIENKKALVNIESIVEVADGVMIARGDLGESLPLEQLAWWQKKIITVCRMMAKPVIVATEMLLSMVDNKMPTRAEATDVANAVFDGTDALMLSEETAIGHNPELAVKQMVKIASFCEKKNLSEKIDRIEMDDSELLIEAAVATILTTGKFDGIAVFTASGRSARVLSSYRLDLPIVAVSNKREVLKKLDLCFGVETSFNQFDNDRFDIRAPIFSRLFARGSKIMVVHGNNWIKQGETSNISIMTV